MTTGVVALVGVGLLFAAWVLDFVLPGSGIAIWAIVAAGVGCVVVAALWDLRRVRSALSSRRGVFGIGQSVILSLAIGTVVLANLVSTTVYHRFDFTGLKQFTLTAQTREVLAELDTEVEVVSFFAEPNPNMEHAAEIAAINAFGFELLKEYRNYNDRLQVRREDPELRPDLARQYSVSPYGAAVGTVVFRSEFGQMPVYGPQIQGEAESAFTSAILQVTGTRQRVVLFVTGHGEGSILGEYEQARRGLRDNLFQVGELSMDQITEIPLNATIVVVAGPQEPLARGEIEMLDRYLREGGRLALLLNPNPATGVARLRQGLVVDRRRWHRGGYGLPRGAQRRHPAGRPRPKRVRTAGDLLPRSRRDRTGRGRAGGSGAGSDCLYHCTELDRAFAPGCLGPGIRP